MSCVCNPFYPSIDRLEQGKRTMSTTVMIDPRFHDAVIFDLDGVVTDTASIHAAAWAAMFNDFLQRRQASDDEDHSPFTDDDYRHFVDGKARGDGVTDFLASRGISLPPGSPTDSTEDTISGLGERKQEIFLERLHAGVPVFESTVVLVRKLADTGVAVGVYSSSRNCERILKDAGLGDLFSVRVDGVAAQDLGLPGKPDPAVLLEATRRLGAVPRAVRGHRGCRGRRGSGQPRRFCARHRRRPDRSRRGTPPSRCRCRGARSRRCRRA